ncbi:MAG: rod shape-determining protein MreC [Gemmatimonadetes bacterium]|nr:rod shape-determining protein MreC [Gemmatimonadota bacterium]
MNGFRDEAVLILAVALSLVLIGIGDGPLSHATLRVVALAFHPPRATVGWIDEGRALRREYSRIAGRLANAEQQLTRHQELRAENRRLRRVLDFCDRKPSALVAARVIALQGAPRSGDLTMIINKGARVGIRVGMAVITPDGFVGRIAIANDFSSAVEPLFSRQLAVSAYDLQTRVVGIARWFDGARISLDNVPLHCEVAVGDTIATSGLGARYPRGVRIGVVDRVQAHDYELFRKIDVTPSVEFNRIEEVLVVLSIDPEVESLVFDETGQTLLPSRQP